MIASSDAWGIRIRRRGAFPWGPPTVASWGTVAWVMRTEALKAGEPEPDIRATHGPALFAHYAEARGLAKAIRSTRLSARPVRVRVTVEGVS